MSTTETPDGNEISAASTTDADDYEAALQTLHEAHSLALRLHDAGVDDDVIGEYLHIEPESVSTLLDLARRKLQSALHRRNL